MLTPYKTGIWAEYYVAAYLALKGYRILGLRYKTPVGEIDIIARNKNTVVFVEVKYRQDGGDALYAVLPQSQRRIRRAAEHYMLVKSNESFTLGDGMRFDVVAINRRCRVNHLKNAF